MLSVGISVFVTSVSELILLILLLILGLGNRISGTNNLYLLILFDRVT